MANNIEISVGRQGWLGAGLESEAGEAASLDKAIPFEDCSLSSQIETIDNESAKGIRDASWGSAVQEHSGGGDLEVLADAEVAPFLLIPALGDYSHEEITLSDGTADKHVIKRKASNPPQTATYYYNNTVELRQFTYATFESLELSFSDEWVTLSGTVISRMPTTLDDGDDDYTDDPGFTDDYAFAFKDANIYFVDDIDSDYDEDDEIKLSDFDITFNNETEAQYLSGSNDPAEISYGEFSADGSYTLFFDDVEERENLETQTKRGMIVEIKGDKIGEEDATDGDDIYESITVKIPAFRITERSIDTSPSDFVTENPSFVADYDSDKGYSVKVEVINEAGEYMA
ncbi:MAG: phage tail tube protein [archaeon]